MMQHYAGTDELNASTNDSNGRLARGSWPLRSFTEAGQSSSSTMNMLQIAIAVVVGLIYMGMGIAAVFFKFTPYPALNLVFCVVCLAYGGFRIYRGWLATKGESSL